MRAGSSPLPTSRSSRSIFSSTDRELASEFVPNTARPTLCEESHRHWRTNRSGSADRSARNGVTTGERTPLIRAMSLMPDRLPRAPAGGARSGLPGPSAARTARIAETSGAEPSGSVGRRRLEDLDGVARGILDEDLGAAGALDDVVPEPNAGRPQALHLGGDVVHDHLEAGPPARDGLAAVGHRSAGRAGASAQQEPEIAAL